MQGGEDQCRPFHVTREQLVRLRDLCTEVIALKTTKQPLEYSTLEEGQIKEVKRTGHALTGESQKTAEMILPTQEGFFFGSTDYDEWYLRDVEDTIKQLNRALQLGEEWNFEYQSSW